METLSIIQANIEKAAAGAIEAHDLRTRHAGPVTFIQFHLVVPVNMTRRRKADHTRDRIETRFERPYPVKMCC